jgi:hypothetical protein
MFVTALLAASLSALVPKLKPPVPYFPVTVGTKWVLERNTEGTVTEVVEEVLEAEEKDGGYAVTVTSAEIREKGRGTVNNTRYLVSGTTLVQTRGDFQWTVFDLGVKAGEGWKAAERKERGAKVGITYTIGKEEVVEVPAGKFNAVPVTEQRGISETKTARWYAPGVGVVKAGTDSRMLRRTAVLKSFTPGKDAKK